MKFLMLLLLVLVGCQASILRDRDTYLAEVTFTHRLLREGAPAVRSFVGSRCVCSGDAWRTAGADATDQQCLAYAEWWTVYTARWPWHHDMMLFNAHALAVRPGAVPPIPPVTCNLPPVPVE